METRGIRPPDDIEPNENEPLSVPPSTVGPDQLVTPGDPHGVTLSGPENLGWVPPTIMPSGWSGWPGDWWPPNWNGRGSALSDIEWTCLDLNASLLATMPPYLVNAAPSLPADWLRNPDPDLYTSWEEFAKQLFWDYQARGEVFVLVTARYSTGWPARFHVVPGDLVEVEMDVGARRYSIGQVDVTGDILHVRYQSQTTDARGHGPLEAAASRVRSAVALARYSSKLVEQGGIPTSILEHPEQLSEAQATALKAKWVEARLSSLGEPAVLSGGVKWTPTQLNPTDMALLDLAGYNEARIAVMLKVPPFLVGLPSGGDSMTYSNVISLFDYHWRAGLRPMATAVMAAMSEWLLPRGTGIEVNRDAYVQPEPLQRAQTYEILNRIKDDDGRPVMTVEQIQQAERLNNATPADLSSGVLK